MSHCLAGVLAILTLLFIQSSRKFLEIFRQKESEDIVEVFLLFWVEFIKLNTDIEAFSNERKKPITQTS